MEKAIIEQVINKYKYKVRIVRFYNVNTSSGALNMDALPEASVCIQPGCIPAYYPGDIVYVEFENDRLDQPVILGKLYCESTNDKSTTTLTDNVYIPEQPQIDYENRLQIIEQRLYKLEE